MISIPERIIQSFIYVDCGARGENNHPFVSAFPGSQYIGFEADAAETDRIQINMKEGRKIFPVALGGQKADLPFYVTRNPACSSFLEPDQVFFSQFLDAVSDIEVLSVINLPVVTLDGYLSEAGFHSVDFMEIDTQGSELDILRGADIFLKKSVLGLRVEVEFSPIYKNQPLFSDVDSFLRPYGFVLFDLSRHRYRRSSAPRSILTKGQLLYGHAVYMRDYKLLTGVDAWLKTIKLIMIADFFRFRDYAYEMAAHLIGQSQPVVNEFLLNIIKQYEFDLSIQAYAHPLTRMVSRFGMRDFFARLARLSTKLSGINQTKPNIGRRSWND